MTKCTISSIATIIVAVSTLAVTSLGEDAPGPHLPKTKIRRAWYRGFMGYINLPIEEDVERGWRMILDFRRRIKYLEVCGAVVDYVSDDKRRYYLSNETWDGVLSEGDILRLFFTADTFPKVRGQTATIQFLSISSSSGPTAIIPTESSWPTRRATSGSPGVNRTESYTSGTVTAANLNLTSNVTGTQLTETVTHSSYGTTTTASTPGITTAKSTTESGDVCIQTCGSSTNINSEWSGNFGGELTVPVTNTPTNGWTATIWFQNTVTSLQIYNARVVSSYTTEGGDTVYTIRNQSWNSDLTWSGPNLYLTFIASIPSSQSGQTFYAHLNGQPECVCGA